MEPLIRYDCNGLPDGFASSNKDKAFSKSVGSKPSSPTSTTNYPSCQHSHFTAFDPPTKQEKSFPLKSPTRINPFPPTKISEGRDLPSPSLPIPIPKPPANTQASTIFMSSLRGDYSLSIPIGRPPTFTMGRNRYGLAVSTGRPNPFLHPPSCSSLPPRSSRNVAMPAQSPTTPNRRMMFPMEMPPRPSGLRSDPGFAMRRGFGGRCEDWGEKGEGAEGRDEEEVRKKLKE